MKCPNCGEDVANESRYCESCGYNLILKHKNVFLHVWIATLMVLFFGIFFYVDNPSAHSGTPEVVFLGRNDDGQLRFLMCTSSSFNQLNYAWNSVRIEVSDGNALVGYAFSHIDRDGNKRFISFDKLCVDHSNKCGDASFYWSEYIELVPGEHYFATIKGTHKGILFNRKAKNVYFEFLLPTNESQ